MFPAIEDAVVARLQAKLGDGVQVFTEQDHASKTFRQSAPSVAVVYDGFALGDDVKVGQHVPIQQVYLEWFTVITTKSARGNGDETEARNEAAALSVKVLEALLGFHAGGGKYFRLHETPGPSYSAGSCMLPLAWRCAATFKGAP